MSLIPLDKFNAIKHRPLSIGNDPIKHGLACPTCGSELMDSAPNVFLASNPPQKSVHCACGFKGLRLA